MPFIAYFLPSMGSDSLINGIRFTIALSTIGFHHTYTQFFSSLSLPPFLLHNLFLAPAVLESHTEASFCVFVLYFILVHLSLVLIVLFFFFYSYSPLQSHTSSPILFSWASTIARLSDSILYLCAVSFDIVVIPTISSGLFPTPSSPADMF